MNWTQLKDKIYFEDGSLRDIYVLGTNNHDWKKWVELINEKYTVEFFDGKADLIKDKIDFKQIEDYWSVKNREIIYAKIKLASVNIICHFFSESEIENHFDPQEVDSLDCHNEILAYLQDIAATLVNDVHMTDENYADSKLITVKSNGDVKLSV